MIAMKSSAADQLPVGALLAWYGDKARDLPWRAPGASPWAVLVSEVMLQQTPVNRVLPVYASWLARWPKPADLAAAPSGEAIREWGRLGYPRRALRLHECAGAIVDRHGGEVPDDVEDLLALPGIGTYTAHAVAAFAYRQRVPVIDTNVRRVLARFLDGIADSAGNVGTSDLERLKNLLPRQPERAAQTSVSLMELGALICVARTPRCVDCPVAADCRWRLAGCPDNAGPARRPQGFAGTDRQVRGLLMAVLRESSVPVPAERLDTVWPKPAQRARALDGLVADGLVDPLPDGRYALPGMAPK
jgi:A/G-specific adenine glycosylase